MGIYYGSFINALAIALGGALGLALKKSVPKELLERLQSGLGFCVLVMGIKMAIAFESALVVILSMVAGVIIGYLWTVAHDRYFKKETKAEAAAKNEFTQGFLMASLVFCTGSMAIVGGIYSGTQNNHDILISKAIIDGLISISFCAAGGLGCLFSAVPVFLYQGTIAFLADRLSVLSEKTVLNNISGVGGILLVLIGVSLSGLKPIRVGLYFPAIIVAMVLASLWH